VDQPARSVSWRNSAWIGANAAWAITPFEPQPAGPPGGFYRARSWHRVAHRPGLRLPVEFVAAVDLSLLREPDRLAQATAQRRDRRHCEAMVDDGGHAGRPWQRETTSGRGAQRASSPQHLTEAVIGGAGEAVVISRDSCVPSPRPHPA